MIRNPRVAFFKFIQKSLGSFGYQLIKREKRSSPPQAELPMEAKEYLTPDNARLKALMAQYLTIKKELTNSQTWNWAEEPANPYLLQYFRGDTMYVWQLRGLDSYETRYTITTYFLLLNDKMNLLNSLTDDALFGNHLFPVAGKKVSRELLDSVNEINFLQSNLNLSTWRDLKILDIGSGYGRMAHRLTQAFPGIKKYYCTDAVPHSLFICEFYIKFRKIVNAEVVEMTRIETELASFGIDLAINIHSFSECTIQAIDWWIAQLANAKVRYLMVVPNAGPDSGNQLLTNRREDFMPVINRHGYKLVVKTPKYADPAVQRHGLFPSHYYLFEKQ
jgi:hypothetical protein